MTKRSSQAEPNSGNQPGSIAILYPGLANNCVRLDWTVDRADDGALEFHAGLGARPAPDELYFRVAGDDLSILAGQRP
jgi:hypothetical protein